jgi:hypothetical protein
VTLDVTARQPHGRLAWRFEMDSMYAQARRRWARTEPCTRWTSTGTSTRSPPTAG